MANIIEIGGVTYPSCAAAARAFGVTRSAMQHRLDAGRLEDLVRKTEPIVIRGVTYGSITAAAHALGVVPSAISHAKSRGNLDGVGDGATNRARKVEVAGRKFASLKELSDLIGWQRQKVAWALQGGKKAMAKLEAAVVAAKGEA